MFIFLCIYGQSQVSKVAKGTVDENIRNEQKATKDG